MCGICGKFSLTEAADTNLINEMCHRLAHRGPDDQGVYIDGTLGLGNRRLAIQDLSQAGHMPMSDGSGRFWITYNGEVYNFRELRQELVQKGHQFYSGTDTEVALHSYMEWGASCLSRFNGMFAFAIWDSSKKELFLARDRMGIKPLYYSFDGSNFQFASESKALLADPSLKREIDPRGLVNYFTFGHAVAPDTILQRIKKLLPGHYLICFFGKDRNSLHLDMQQYWSPPVPTDRSQKDLGEEHYARQVYELLEQSVRRRLVADVPIGVFLSGGIDSSATTALMSSLSTGRIKTYSIGFTIGGSDYNELQDARRVAEAFGTDHHEWILGEQDLTNALEDLVYQYDEPFGDSASFPTFLVSKFAREDVPVALSGEGSDELFGGYRRYIAEKFGDYYRKLPGRLTNGMSGMGGELPSQSSRIKKALQVVGNDDHVSRYASWFSLFDEDMRSSLLNTTWAKASCGIDSLDVYRRCLPDTKTSSLSRALYLDQRVWLPDTYLEKVDKASMAVGLETRVPFLDHELVEYAATIPAKYKVKGKTTKYILKAALKDVLPPATLRKPKHGFAVPTDLWFKGRLNGLVQDLLYDQQARSRGFFNTDYIKLIHQQHCAGTAKYHRHLWLLIVFEIWCRRYGITA